MADNTEKWQFDARNTPLVKVCGLTRKDNALACALAGADIIGLVFYPKSPRNVDFDQAKQIVDALPPSVPACGVFVDSDFDFIMAAVKTAGLKLVQLHGNEPPELARQLAKENLVVIKAFFAARSPGLETIKDFPGIDFYLAEYGKGSLPGGNAETWDYGLAKGAAPQERGEHTGIGPPDLMLAGGLTPGNLDAAIQAASPAAVDASSSLESAPGVKDIEKVKAFVQAAKSS